jgi:myo-inositol 2-dehydrogenase/D-chiro-inositol 1-dehydrogenase
MNLAVLGTDADVLDLLTAAVAEGHELAWIGDVRAEDQSALRSMAPFRLQTSSDWETLLDHATADAVLVGRGGADDELRAEQLKRLAADSVPLLVVHPAGLSVLTYYELDMVRRETGGILRHYNPLAGDPMLVELARWVRDGHESIGDILQVACTRELADGSRESALGALARDVEVLAAVAGDIRHVSAVGPRPAERGGSSSIARFASEHVSFRSLQVQMATAAAATLRWSCVPKTSDCAVEMNLIGERGSIAWRPAAGQCGRSHEQTLRLTSPAEATDQAEPQHLIAPAFDGPRAAIREFAAAVSDNDAERRAASSTWAKATQAMEVVDAVELSLQKGRTIEVHQQQLTEALAFRGTMAALGCGLLLLVTFVMIVTAFVGGVEWFLQKRVMQSWALALLAVLSFFLALQFVPYLADPKRNRKSTGSGSESNRE